MEAGERNSTLAQLDLCLFIKRIDLLGRMIEKCVADEIILFAIVSANEQ